MFLLKKSKVFYELHRRAINNGIEAFYNIKMDTIKELIYKNINETIGYRRWMHRHPEASHHEKNTSEYICKALEEIGLHPTVNIAGYGITASIEGKKRPASETGKHCIALRADFDALEIEENTDCNFKSENPGYMHACGHDVHAAMLLGAAKVLSNVRQEFSGIVKLIFQPAEEDSVNSGAKSMIEAGVLDNPKVEAVLGQHVFPDLFTGTIWLNEAYASASSDRFSIKVKGLSSHAGMCPEKGIDAIVIAAEIINALQTIVSRRIGPCEECVISIGKIVGGQRYNIVANDVLMEGTCRTVSEDVRQKAEKCIRDISCGIAESLGGTAEVKYARGLPSIINAPHLHEIVRSESITVLGKDNIMDLNRPNMAGEDFGHYSRVIPSYFYWLGCRKADGSTVSLHSDIFLPDENCIPIGIEVMVRSALRFLNEI